MCSLDDHLEVARVTSSLKAAATSLGLSSCTPDKRNRAAFGGLGSTLEFQVSSLCLMS